MSKAIFLDVLMDKNIRFDLSLMTQATYELFLKRSIPEYATGREQAESITPEQALKRAQDQFHELLPQGQKTEGHHFFNITLDNETIGELWIAARDRAAFIYELYLNPEARGKEYGKKVMSVIDDKVRELGFTCIRLHVFGHNKVALHLYQSCGYIATNINMKKEL